MMTEGCFFSSLIEAAVECKMKWPALGKEAKYVVKVKHLAPF